MSKKKEKLTQTYCEGGFSSYDCWFREKERNNIYCVYLGECEHQYTHNKQKKRSRKQ